MCGLSSWDFYFILFRGASARNNFFFLRGRQSDPNFLWNESRTLRGAGGEEWGRGGGQSRWPERGTALSGAVVWLDPKPFPYPRGGRRDRA